MICFDSTVSLVYRYIRYVYVPLEMKETTTGAIIIRIL